MHFCMICIHIFSGQMLILDKIHSPFTCFFKAKLKLKVYVQCCCPIENFKVFLVASRIKQGELNTLFYIIICSIFCVFRSEIACGIELTSISLAFQYLALFFNCQLTSVFLYTILSLPSFSVLYRCIVCQFCFPAYYFIAIIFQYYIFA